MLEEREQVQSAARNRLAGTVTRVTTIILALLAIAFFSSSGNREAVASMFRGASPEATPPPQPPAPSGNAPETAEDQFLRDATNATRADVSSLMSHDGKIVSKEDIEFAAELLNFGRLPEKHEDPPPAKATEP